MRMMLIVLISAILPIGLFGQQLVFIKGKKEISIYNNFRGTFTLKNANIFSGTVKGISAVEIVIQTSTGSQTIKD